MGDKLDAIFEAKEKELLDFIKEMKRSDRYHKLSDETKERMDHFVKAFGGNAKSMILLSKELF